MRATVWVEEGFVWARVAWDPVRSPILNESLKARLPKGTRRWNPEKKAWQFDPAYDSELLEILEAHCTQVHVLEPERQVIEVPVPAGQDAYGQMLRLAPTETLKRFHREMVVTLHPDRGGEHEKMIALNSAWEKIRKDRGI